MSDPFARLASMNRTLAAAVAMALATNAVAAEPHRSATALPSSNGRATIVFDLAKDRVDTFLEHPYRFPSAGVESRNFLWDMYPGIRVGAAGTPGAWLPDVTPSLVEYVPATGIVHVRRELQGLTLDEYDFAPMSLSENAALVLLKVTRDAPGDDVNAFFLANLHLGAGSPDPSSDNERLVYNTVRDAYYVSGDSGVAVGFGSVVSSTGRTAAAGGDPKNPYDALQAGADFTTDVTTPTTGNDLVGGFQSDLGAMAVGGTQWLGWYVVLAPDANAQDAVDRVKTWISNRTPEQLYDGEVADWNAWVTPPPASASADEAMVDAQSQVFLRMAQVQEPGSPHGQLLASLPPGQWNIAWVRDMAYATVALVRTGHLAEAKDAIAFQLGATAGTQEDKVGMPYQISVCRYFGDGTEESDVNDNGPNVEFDGFGLFLWEVDEYLRASSDAASLAAWWPKVRDGVANVLLHLQQSNGLVAADSSIWEVHWNGQQKHFAYTTIAAARGFEAAADLATLAGDAADASTYAGAARKARDALALVRSPDDAVLTEAQEVVNDPAHRLDGAVLEALNFGLVDPTGVTANATLDALLAGLTPPSGHGIFRDQWGSSYDSQEWVLLDLRLARALELAGRADAAKAMFDWNTEQAAANFGILSELLDANTADYAGAAPMIGFGAGAYLLRLDERGKPGAPLMGSYLAEEDRPPKISVSPHQATVTAGQSVEITIVASDPDPGDQLTVSVSVDGGPAQTLTGASAESYSLSPSGVGPHQAIFTATDRAGKTASDECEVQVNPPPPKVAFQGAVAGSVGITVNVVASAVEPGGDNSGFSWTVDFGDGTPTVERDGVTAVQIPHRYTKAGTFTVTGIAVDGAGRSGSATTEAKITGGCGCSADPLQGAWLLGLVLLWRRRRRSTGEEGLSSPERRLRRLLLGSPCFPEGDGRWSGRPCRHRRPGSASAGVS